MNARSPVRARLRTDLNGRELPPGHLRVCEHQKVGGSSPSVRARSKAPQPLAASEQIRRPGRSCKEQVVRDAAQRDY